jgi:hypothetical protein
MASCHLSVSAARRPGSTNRAGSSLSTTAVRFSAGGQDGQSQSLDRAARHPDGESSAFARFRKQPVLPRRLRRGYRLGVMNPDPSSGSSCRRGRVLWVGPSGPADLRLAREWVARLADVHDVASPAAAVAAPPEPFTDRSPAVVFVAVPAPGNWSLADVVPLAIRWPLAPIVAVGATLADGRRRSGPPLPGVEEVPWHDVPGRLAMWLADREAGRAGTLGMPATARREDRFLDPARSLADVDGPLVSLAAASGSDLDGLADLTRAAGAVIGRRSRGRPPLDEPAPVLVWDVGRLEPEHLAWLRMLAANRPGLRIILLESFPRPDTASAALQAGAAAVLGRPASAETLAGTLLWVSSPTGLSAGLVAS